MHGQLIIDPRTSEELKIREALDGKFHRIIDGNVVISLVSKDFTPKYSTSLPRQNTEPLTAILKIVCTHYDIPQASIHNQQRFCRENPIRQVLDVYLLIASRHTTMQKSKIAEKIGRSHSMATPKRLALIDQRPLKDAMRNIVAKLKAQGTITR